MIRPPMQSLLELAPLLAFLVAYYAKGIYFATAVLMGAMVLLLAIDYLRTRRIPPMHALSAALVFVFGSATLILHNARFIQWKPTMFFWLASIAFLASAWIGDRPLVQRLIGAAAGSEVTLPRTTWLRLNWRWGVFYAVLVALNLLVAFNASESTWVTFKVFGLTIATFMFVAAQIFWLARRSKSVSAT